MSNRTKPPIAPSSPAPVPTPMYQAIPKMPVKARTALSDDLIKTPNRVFGVQPPKTSWSSIQTMPRDIAQYAIDPAIWINTKSADIERHGLDEQLDRFQRTLLCLNGDISQKIFGAHELPNLIKNNTERTFTEIMPIIANELKKIPNVDLQAEVAHSLVKSFKFLVNNRNMKRIKTILEIITTSTDHSDPEIAATWMEALEEIIDLMSPKDSFSKVVPIIQAKVQANKSSLSKRGGCVLIRKLALRVPDSSVSQAMVPIIRDLANDRDFAVRSAACMILPDLVINSDPTTIGEYMKILTQVSRDQDGAVKTCLMDSIGRMVVSDVFKRQPKIFRDVLKLLKKIVKEAFYQDPSNIPLLVHFSKYIAPTAINLNEILSNDDKYWFVDAFLQLCKYNLPNTLGKHINEIPLGFVTYRNRMSVDRRPSLSNTLLGTVPKPQEQPLPMIETGRRDSVAPEEIEPWMVRAHCAANLLDFIRFAKPHVEFKSGLYIVVSNLTRDPNPNIRKNLAGGMHSIMEEVQENSALFKDEVIRLLSDDNVDVIEAIVPNLARILKLFVKTNVVSPETTTQAMSEIGGVILFCEERLSQTRDWRVHSSLLLQLVVLPFCMPCDHIYNNFVPMLIHRLINLNQLPSRLGAAEALISFLRNCRRASQRNEIRRKIRGFANSRSAQDRMLYLYMSSMIMDRFSRKYFREHFFDTTLHLAEDKIPNVRTKAVRLMPKMKEKLINAEDNQFLQRLNEIFASIQKSESDREALAAMQYAVDEMAKIEVYLKGDPNHKVLSKNDKDDLRKEKEENYIAALEQKMPDTPLTKLSAGGGAEKNNLRRMLSKKSIANPDRTRPPVHLYAPTEIAATLNIKPKMSIVEQIKNPTGSNNKNDLDLQTSYNLPRNSVNIVPLATTVRRTESFMHPSFMFSTKETDSSRSTSTNTGLGKRKTTHTFEDKLLKKK